MAQISDLPPRERVDRYRQMAEEAEHFGRGINDAIGRYYLTVAAQWRKLADDIEGTLGEPPTK